MVKQWQKSLLKTSVNLKNIDFEKVIEDISQRSYSKYDIKTISWYKNLFRIRIWDYRLIFLDKQEDSEPKILLFWKRWDVYNHLKNL